VLSQSLSALGSILLLIGYLYIGIFKKETSGLYFSAFGSLLMCLSFYDFNSQSFLFLNAVWFTFSVVGLVKRKKTYANIAHNSCLPLALLVVVSFSALWLVISQSWELASWVTVSLFISSYILFTTQLLTNTAFVFFSMVGSLTAIPYLVNLENYPPILNNGIDIIISLLSLTRNQNILKQKLK
jgi:hypothetical protein